MNSFKVNVKQIAGFMASNLALLRLVLLEEHTWVWVDFNGACVKWAFLGVSP